MTQIIPLTSESYQDFTVILDDIEYTFELLYNERSVLWTLNILDSAKDLILGGICLRVNYSLLEQYSNEALPQGRLFVIDQSGAGLDPTADDLGERVVMAYEPV